LKKLIEKHGGLGVIGIFCSIVGALVAIPAILAYVGPVTDFFKPIWGWICDSIGFIVCAVLLGLVLILLYIINGKVTLSKQEVAKLMSEMNRVNGEMDNSVGALVGDLKATNGDCKRICSDCGSIKEFYEERMSVGIFSVKSATHYDHEYFKRLYKRTHKTLSITAHTLHKTIGNRTDVRDEFENAVLRVLGSGGTVKILLQCFDEHNEELKKRRANVHLFVSEIYKEIDNGNGTGREKQTIKRNLMLKEVHDMPYYIVQNEDTTLLAHYRASDNAGLYVFRVDERRGYGEFYLSDFEREFSAAQTINIT
jgi:hypothetical protein